MTVSDNSVRYQAINVINETCIIQQAGKTDDDDGVVDYDDCDVDDDGDVDDDDDVDDDGDVDEGVESPPSKCPMRSMGSGKMTVEFFSAEIELSV